jgi:hypothetical protein
MQDMVVKQLFTIMRPLGNGLASVIPLVRVWEGECSKNSTVVSKFGSSYALLARCGIVSINALRTLLTDSGVVKTWATSSSKTTTLSACSPARAANRFGFAFW